MSEFCFFLFYSFQQVGFLSRMTRCLFYVSNADQWNVLVFLDFLNLIFNFQKSRIGLFVTVFLTLCPYSLHSRLYHSSFVLAPTFIFVILIFSVVKILNEFSFFLDLGFFGLQLIELKIRQYWEFARKSFPTFLLITIHCNFLPVLVLFLDDFLPLNIILLLLFFYH